MYLFPLETDEYVIASLGLQFFNDQVVFLVTQNAGQVTVQIDVTA